MLIISETQFIYIQPTHQTISISIYLLKNIKLEWFLLLLLHWQKKAGLRMMDVHHWYSFYLDAQSCKIETGKCLYGVDVGENGTVVKGTCCSGNESR